MLIRRNKNLTDLFFRDFDELFNDQSNFSPLNDIVENENEYQVDLMLPAFNKKDFNIKVENNELIIEGERKNKDETKYNIRQSYFGKFRKIYSLPDFVDTDNIDAKYKDGVLSIKVPKSEEKLAKRLIEVK